MIVTHGPSSSQFAMCHSLTFNHSVMRRTICVALWLSICLLTVPTAVDVLHAQKAIATSPMSDIAGDWRIEHGVVAPWAHAGSSAPNTHALVGRTVRFDRDRVTGPGALTCTRATYDHISQPAAGLFQGNLPKPANTSAEPLGMIHFPIPGTRLNCDSGSYDFHRVDRNSMLLGLDNVVWTLTRAPGALAATGTPSAVVELFLEQHFAGDMGFLRESVAQKSQWMTDTLRQQIATYLARPSPKDETPVIDGDPFTDSQEYPTRFAVASAVLKPTTASVTVRFRDAYRERVVYYLLHQQGGVWRIADTRCEHNETLTSLLK